MLSRLLSILILWSLMFSASAAWAATPGPYLAVAGYGTWLEESDNQTATGNFNARHLGGGGGGVAVGYDLVDAYPALGRGRVELEVASRRSGLDELDFPEGTLPVSGDITMNSLMFQTCAEYRRKAPLVPYVSIGVGYAEVSIDPISPVGEPFIASSSDGVLACQLGAGVGVELGQHLTVDLGYRYFATRDPKFTLADGSEFTSEIVSHSLLLGLRVKF